MSRLLTSLGVPYFQMAQSNLAGVDADTLYGSGLCDLSAVIEIDRLPTKHASNTELHAIMSFQYQTFPITWAPLLELGITPEGCLRAVAATGADVSSPVASLAAGTGRHSIRCWYDYSSGVLSLYLDDVAYTDTDAGGVTLVSPAGEPMRIVLFNGATFLANTHLSIHSAQATARDINQGGDPHPAPWDMAKGYGTSLPASVDDADFPGLDFTLNAETPVSGYHPYTRSSLAPAQAMHWGLYTPWTQRTRPRTSWAKAGR